MRLHTFILTTLLVALAPLASTAGSGQGCSVVEHIFEMADQDADGALTPDEYEAAGLERYGVTFDETDADGDGETSMAEYLDLYERHHAPPDEAGDVA